MIPLLHEPMYTVADAARLAHLTPSRVRRWLYGYHYEWGPAGKRRFGQQPPVIDRATSEGRPPSFLDLMELLFAKAFLDHGVSLRRVRRALEEARIYTKEDHPFAKRRFFCWGRDVFMELRHQPDSEIVQLLEGGQLAIRPVVLDIAHRIDFDADTQLAAAWWPLGKKKPVIVDPKVAFGAPSIARKGVKTANVYDMYVAEGRRAEAVTFWLGLEAREVAAAVEFEESIKKAA